MNHFFTAWTENKYVTTIIIRARKYSGGGTIKPKCCPKGVNGISRPMVRMYIDVNIKN